MGRRSALASVTFDVEEQSRLLPRPDPDKPFRILVLGDFSAHAQRGSFDPSWTGRKPVMVDRNSIEEALARLAPALEIPLDSEEEHVVSLSFREMDDFEPDRLLDSLDPFSESIGPALAAAAPCTAVPPPVSDADLLRRMLGEAESAPRPVREMDEWDKLVHDIVAPFAASQPDPRAAAEAAGKNAARAALLRAVLHHPDFQALESAWRSLFFLVCRIDTSSGLQIFFLDVSKAELSASLIFCDDVHESAAYRELAEHAALTPGAHPWSVIAGLYAFDAGPQDHATLARMAVVARIAGAPFLAQASPRLLGCDSMAGAADSQQWRPPNVAAVRRKSEAQWLGLALPRFLLRVPYGADGTSVARLRFEEMPEGSVHAHYLWGNPALVCVALLARSFVRAGWQMRPGMTLELGGLPAHACYEDREPRLNSCTEVLLTERAAERLLDCGIMPLATLEDTDRARLVRFQSYADPAAPLAGPWD